MATELSRFPRIADKLPALLAGANADTALATLHTLFEHRDYLGFVLLDRDALRRLEAALPQHTSRQTPYIPPRIWAYQVNRLHEFLEEFHAHRASLENCFQFCLDSYIEMQRVIKKEEINASRRPSPFAEKYANQPYYVGPFSQLANRFGIEKLLRKWILQPDESMDQAGRSVNVLSSYLTLVGKVGTAYILNFSLMRFEEAWALHTDCLITEKDVRFGTFYILRGTSTKTVYDDDAHWVTSSSTKMAVDAMACVSRLRANGAKSDPKVSIDYDYIKNPHLVTRQYEPWAPTKNLHRPMRTRPMYASYQGIISDYPNLFDNEQLKITEDDLKIASLITPSLDRDLYLVGEPWPLAWHQLRRTGAVNMQASGLVSDSSLQYQLKHANRDQSLYYGQGYSRLRLNDEARNQYIRTLYEMLANSIVDLFSDNYVSPYGVKRKNEILKFIEPKKSAKLLQAAKSGQVAWRETLLGGCTKRGPCEYGGIDNVARCGGGDGKPPCNDALFDTRKEQAIRALKSVIHTRLFDAPPDSPYRESLLAQDRALENALHHITNK
ncbi:hypothetical protein [Cupriavidus oxalaticus]|uniref:hypothetical protein n=1 Tax=Cupriavidus oxalaticus TaxID=96344 RepID=UPI003F73C877